MTSTVINRGKEEIVNQYIHIGSLSRPILKAVSKATTVDADWTPEVPAITVELISDVIICVKSKI